MDVVTVWLSHMIRPAMVMGEMRDRDRHRHRHRHRDTDAEDRERGERREGKISCFVKGNGREGKRTEKVKGEVDLS